MEGLLIYTEVKTIDTYSEEYLELKRQNEQYQNSLDSIWEKLNNLETRQDIWDKMK
jgi:hypothetical protein